MKYKLIGTNDYAFDPQQTIFENRGIMDMEQFLTLSIKDTHHYKLLKNIDIAVKSLDKHIKRDNNILIVVDPDVDGYTSAAIMYQYIKLINSQVKVYYALHNDKTHGLKGIHIEDHINLVITPDSGSNDFEYHKQLKERNIETLVLDHHEIERESDDAIVVSTLLGEYPNHNLSGAGVVFKLCQALDDFYEVDAANNFIDLVALGNIADSMSMKEPETIYYVREGLANINNDFFQALIRKQEYSLKGKMNITAINFYISPLINAVVRVGELQDKIDMFKAFIEVKELVDYTPRGKEKSIKVPLVDDMARRCSNLKAKQGRIADKLIKSINEKIETNNLNENKALFLYDLDMESGMTGYLANKVAGEYKKPVLLLTKLQDEGFYRGSGRGYDKSELKDFRSIVETSGLFEWAKGHAGAYGASIEKGNVLQVNDKLNQLLKDYTFDNYYLVDFKIKAPLLETQLIFDICELDHVWGKDVDEPYLFIENIPVNEADINLMGKKEDTISVYYNEVKFLIYKTDYNVYSQLINAKHISVIGKAKINDYKNKQTGQIEVVELEYK